MFRLLFLTGIEQMAFYKKFFNPGLVLITDRSVCCSPLENVVIMAVKGGVNTVQLREKDLPSCELFDLACKLRKITRDLGANFIVNERADITLAVDADGVHIGKSSIPIGCVRRIVGNDKLIGYSAHSLKEAKDAQERGADYISFSPIFMTTSQGCANQHPVGAKVLKEVKLMVQIPVVALGGINEKNINAVLENGADGVAVISSILKSGRPFDAALSLSEKMIKV